MKLSSVVFGKKNNHSLLKNAVIISISINFEMMPHRLFGMVVVFQDLKSFNLFNTSLYA